MACVSRQLLLLFFLSFEPLSGLRLKTEPKCCGHEECERIADWGEGQIDGESTDVSPNKEEVLR